MAMRNLLIRSLLLASLGLLSGCSGFFDIFDNTPKGAARPIAVIPEGGFVEDSDERDLVGNLASIELLPAVGGVILKANGIVPRLGYYDMALVPENQEQALDGQLTYMFRVAAPEKTADSSTESPRKISAARFISRGKLFGVRRIKVVSEQRSMSVSR